MKKRVLSLLLAIAMIFGMLPVSAWAAETEVPVADNVIDITDKQIYKRNSYHVTATNITVTGADVVSATEDGTTVNVLLDVATAQDAEVSVEFGYSANSCSMTDHKGSVTLVDGAGTLGLKVKGYYSYMASWNSTVDYTIIFTVDAVPTVVPERLVESDAKDTYIGVPVTLELKEYYYSASQFYLVEGEVLTPIEGSTYTYTPQESGTCTLTFAAENAAGMCPDYVTVTVNAEKNEAPALTGEAELSQAVNQYSTWSIDLGTLFVDAEGSEMTYTVSIDGAESAAANANYSYAANTDGVYEFVFVATDAVGAVSPECKVTLTVNLVHRITIDTHCVKTSASFDGWMSSVTITGVEVVDYAWLGGGSGHSETSNEDHTLNVLLAPDVADDAEIALSYGHGGNTSNSKFSSKPASVTLVDGKATATVVTTHNSIASWVTTRTYTINFTNKENQAPAVEAESESVEVTTGDVYTLDLSTVFTDPEGGALSYTVTYNGETTPVDTLFSQVISSSGEHVFEFTATDTWKAQTTYTVTVTATASNVTYDATVYLPETVDPTFYITSSTGAEGDVCGEQLEALAGESVEGMNPYTVKVPDNVSQISVRGTESEDGDWGGMSFAVSEGAEISLRQVQLNVLDYNQQPSASTNTITYQDILATAGAKGWLLVADVEYTVTALPADSSMKQTSVTRTVEAGSDVDIVDINLDINNPFTITVTTGAKAALYQYVKYYDNNEFDAKIVRDNGDGTTTYYFIADSKSSNGGMIYHVSMEGKISKAGWVSYGAQNLTVLYTEDDKDADYRLDDYSGTGEENSPYTEDSVLLNINSRNHLKLEVGGTKTLKAYRAWEIIPVSYNNWIITPDFTYTILSGEDVVSLTPKDSRSSADGDWMTLTAEKEGIAIIEVTYDAIDVSGTNYITGVYGASDPARTGLVVVQVGGSEDTSVDFGIDCFASAGISGSKNVSYNENAMRAWDVEFDTLYFTGDSGTLDLTPIAASAITEVAVSNDKGESWDVLESENGTYTSTIVSGNNILRVTTESGVSYQVVRGDKVTVQVKEVEGSSDDDGIIEAGETVRVSLIGLHTPIPKMAGNYNPGYYGNSDGYSSIHLNYSANGTAIYGVGAQYNFINAANYVEITLPEDGSSVILDNGYIGLGVMGLTEFTTGGDSHRNIPDGGCATRDSKTSFHTRSILPEIVVEPGEATAPNQAPIVNVDAVTEKTLQEGKKFALNPETLFTDPDGDTMTFTVSVNGGAAEEATVSYKFAPADAGVYTLTFVATDGEFTAEHTVTVTVEAAETEPTDPTDPSEPDETDPTDPSEPEETDPTDPSEPEETDPTDPSEPEETDPTDPSEPEETDPTDPSEPEETDPTDPSEPEVTDPTEPSKPDAEDFGLDEADVVGYAKVSFVDYGIRVEGEKGLAFPEPLGVIVPETVVPFRKDESVAQVTLRLLDYYGIGYEYSGTVESGFYLGAIKNFEVDDTEYEYMGEFDAGVGSGWMITQNGVFINKGASDFKVADGDEIKWQYTCQLGADIGDDYNKTKAQEVEKLIDAIGTVTEDSAETINAARAAYDALTEKQKALVENYDVLVAAEKTLEELNKSTEPEETEPSEPEETEPTEPSKPQETEPTEPSKPEETEPTEPSKPEETEPTEPTKPEETEPVDPEYQEMYKTTGDYMESLGTPTVNPIGGEWMVLGLVRSGRDVPAGYYDEVVKYVRENINDQEQLHRAKSTENARVILALTAAGYDVTNVDGHNLLVGLNTMSYVKKQGNNGPIWALIAFDSHDYEIPAGDVTRESLIDAILATQLSDGGWAMSSVATAGDADLTGMAVQALAPYYKTDAEVKTAVDKALVCLSAMQLADGSFGSVDGSCAESTAQVIVALTAMGIDPVKDQRFVKNGNTLIDALALFYVSSGGFKHVASDTQLNGMATEQAYYALAAYDRFLNGQTSLYDMSDVEIETAKPEDTKPTEPEDTKPTEPEDTKPTEPEDTKPTEPEETKPTEPEDIKPTEPEETKPTEPEETKPTEPEETKPTEPEETKPTEPEETLPPISTDKEPEEDGGKVQTTVKPAVKVEDEMVTAVIPDAVGDKIVSEAAKNEASEIVIAPEVKEDTTKVEVSIAPSAVEKINKDTNADLKIETPVAQITVPNDTLAELAQAEKTVVISAEKKDEQIVVEIVCDGEKVETTESGIAVEVPFEDSRAGTVAVLVYEDGTREIIRESIADKETGIVNVPLSGSAKIEIINNGKTFEDVKETDWHAEAVEFTTARELFKGTSETDFEPNTETTRAMMATLLYRMEGEPAVDGLENPFTDVKVGDWYFEAVVWAADAGVVKGMTETTFAPNDPVTREQMVTMMYRYIGEPEGTEGAHDGFQDAANVSAWAEDAIAWAVANGIITGFEDNTVQPAGNSTRAQIATVLMRHFVNK